VKKPVSKFAFECNLQRYTGVEESPLGELVEFLLQRWVGGEGSGLGGAAAAGGGSCNAVPAATHRLVATAFLDLCVRWGCTR
jgi:hypothetical protein